MSAGTMWMVFGWVAIGVIFAAVPTSDWWLWGRWRKIIFGLSVGAHGGFNLTQGRHNTCNAQCEAQGYAEGEWSRKAGCMCTEDATPYEAP